ncbi:MAG: UDP-N-acetylmuramate--L-alanine ligase [Firmicutes bacterium]|nr:UDP-N-acetylmuramate--L-alanine ligase [Bacillota bacterium]
MRDILSKEINHIHFIGIGGISMSGLAEILYYNGYTVSGSDWTASDITNYLCELGIKIIYGNYAENITEDTDLVVYTAAVKADNPELMAAKQRGLPTMDRAKMLGLIMKGYKNSVAVAGVHGKTTTTSIISDVLLQADMDPTISIGGFMENIGGPTVAGNFRIGKSPYLILEACEYYDSFLQFYPKVGIILNVDSDHLDYFGTIDRLVSSFKRFAENIPPDGTLIIYKASKYFDQITENLQCNIVTYGTKQAQFWAKNVRHDNQGFPTFSIMNGNEVISEVTLKLRGSHNINNALAAVATAVTFGVEPSHIVAGLSRAIGVKRRFEYKGKILDNIALIDDYAHHPTEIKASLATADGTYKRIICAFQSHTYSRTENLLEEFGASFSLADIVLVLPIYAAREVYDGEPNSLEKELTKLIKQNGKQAFFLESFQAATDWIKQNAESGDLLITMGAGDINQLGEALNPA